MLAAGRGSRLQSPDIVMPPKPLVTVRGETLVARTLRVVADAGANPVLAVIGHREADVALAVGDRARVVVARDWREGISASIRAGIAALKPNVDAALLMPVDQPGIEPHDIALLTDAFRHGRPDAVAVRGPNGEQRGAPALFARRVFPRLMALEGDIGARRLLDDANLDIDLVTLPRRALADIDTPEDLFDFERATRD